MNWMPTKSSLTIALDYDDTYTADTALWGLFIRAAHSQGHRVVCITGRRESFENRRQLEESFREHCNTGQRVDVFFAYDMPKALCATKNDLEIDIWIDDIPNMIAPDARVTELQVKLKMAERRANDAEGRLEYYRENAVQQELNAEVKVAERYQKQMSELRAKLAKLSGVGANEHSD